MPTQKCTALACANIAFIKYWGNRDTVRRVPLNDSLSLNLDQATTTTTVEFVEGLGEDEVTIGGQAPNDAARHRVAAHLDRIRTLAQTTLHARVVSRNTFPTGAGIASSASAFAALTVAGSRAAGLDLSQRDLSMLARQASGSACRSIPAGFVEWVTSIEPNDSYAFSIAAQDHWTLHDVIAIVSTEEKQVGSTEGHSAANTSHFLPSRLNALPVRFHRVRRAILTRDLALLGPAIEEDALELHLIAMTSRPPIFYWSPAMVRVIQSVQRWRADGLQVYFTMDAGPNVHLICEATAAEQVATQALAVEGVSKVIDNQPGGAARAVDSHLF